MHPCSGCIEYKTLRFVLHHIVPSFLISVKGVMDRRVEATVAIRFMLITGY